MNPSIFQALPDILLPWYAENRRDLPWRADREPYHIWVSEIMLQQTRVEAAKGYYSRFLAALPTVADLANADDDLLHKLWEGLGYYSRVRNLKKAARVVMEQYGGKFPGEYAAVLALPGIGAYTAGAVCSIAYDLPTPAVDGNVLRLVSRLTDDATPISDPQFKKQTSAALAEIYPAQAGAFTQALMELGATLCGPNRKPDCAACPCNGLCLGFQRGTAEQLPVKAKKAPRRVEQKTVFILSCDGHFALNRRGNTGLLAGLWEFPNLPDILDTEKAIAHVEAIGCKPKQIIKQVERKHIFTHVEWNMRGVYMEVGQMPEQFTWLTADAVRGFAALPTAFRQFWEDEGHV